MKTKQWTKKQALEFIKVNNDINTMCLAPLNIEFDTFLIFAQRSKSDQSKLLKLLVKQFEEA